MKIKKKKKKKYREQWTSEETLARTAFVGRAGGEYNEIELKTEQREIRSEERRNLLTEQSPII